MQAWRAFLGWRKSWFSREVIVFSGYLPLAAGSSIVLWLGLRPETWPAVGLALRIGAALTGLTGIFCSAMIYADTRREFWRASQSLGKFFGTTILLGLALTLTLKEFVQADSVNGVSALIWVMFVTTLAKLGFERRIFGHLVDEETPGPTPLNKTARLLATELGLIARMRVACGILGGCVLPAVVAISGSTVGRGPVIAILILCVTGELLERYLFFTAVAPARMPGGVGT
jgi:DMSO reductase anchor subunit